MQSCHEVATQTTLDTSESDMATLRRRTLLKQFGVSAAGLGIASLFPRPLSAGKGSAQGDLPRSTPQAQGVSAAAISQFLAALDKSGLEVRSLMMLRHGHVVAEGCWTPYRFADAHLLNSISKCFTSTAVGFAVAEGRLTIADRVVKFFPEDLPATVSDNLAALSLKDLLTMSIGHATDSMPIITREHNWVKAFLSLPIEHAPGSSFLYDSGGSYVLSAIVQKLSGQKVMDYLKPRFFDPLAMHGVTWETCPRGINTGGWGMSATIETLAKLGQFYLQRGRWNGVQLLPAAWVSAATSRQVAS
jgi:CubicO group peptidase (beta-lactamase class C family)